MLLAIGLAFLLAASIATLVFVNPSLAVWVAIGLIVGLLLRLAQGWRRGEARTPDDRSAEPRSARGGGLSRAARLVVLVGVFLGVLAITSTALLLTDQPSPSALDVVRADYALTARLNSDDAGWTIDEKYTLGERAVQEVLYYMPPASPAPAGGLERMALATYLAAEFGDGWLPAVDTGDPVLQRTRTTSSKTAGWTTSTHVISLSRLSAGHVVVVPDMDSTAVLMVPRYTIIRTSPPPESRDPVAGEGMEDVRLPIAGDTQAIRAELADGRLRNELFFGLANISFATLTGLAVGGAVSTITAAFGGAVWRQVKGLAGRREPPEGKPQREPRSN